MNKAENNPFVKEFQLRRRRMFFYFGTSMILIVVSLLLMQLSDSTVSFLNLGDRQWRLLAASQFAAGLVFAVIGFKQYRCPSCNTIIRGHDRYYLGVVLDPARCPHCGKRLK